MPTNSLGTRLTNLRFAFGCAWLVLGAAGCDTEIREVLATTQVTLRVTSEDPALRARIDELRASLWLLEDAGPSLRSHVNIPGTELRWPVDIPIVPSRAEDEDAAFEVAVEAWGEGRLLVEKRVRDRFMRKTVRMVLVPLTDDQADAGETPGSARDAAIPDNPMPDAGTPGSPSDAGDAGTTPASDGGPMAVDASSDARVPGQCPADHGCKAPYPCVPTALGYTCRGQFADWPMPDGNAGAKVAPSYSSDTLTVTDNVTKLVWQLGIPSTYPNCNTDEGAAFCTRQDATAYCDALSYGGHDDWRLPSLIELVSLFHTERDAQAGIDVGYFGDTDNFLFVSSSTQANAPSAVWKVNYRQRTTYSYDVPYGRVRCVRGGAEPPFATPADRYAIDMAADTVTDRATGLVWQRTVPDTRFTPDLIAGACSGGFRLPRPNELLSLVDPTREKPAIDPQAFPNTPSDNFWVLPFESLATRYAISFETGELDYFTETGYVRCVL